MIPNKVTACTYETQHNDSGPVCNDLKYYQDLNGKMAFYGFVVFMVFGILAWISERRRITKR